MKVARKQPLDLEMTRYNHYISGGGRRAVLCGEGFGQSSNLGRVRSLLWRRSLRGLAFWRRSLFAGLRRLNRWSPGQPGSVIDAIWPFVAPAVAGSLRASFTTGAERKLARLQSVLFVCWGNVCRSPAAESILKRKLKHRAISNVKIKSAGIAADFKRNRPSPGMLWATLFRGLWPRPKPALFQ
jgi:hypothetical protein